MFNDFDDTQIKRNHFHLDVINLIDLLIILIIFLISTTAFAKFGLNISTPKSTNTASLSQVSLKIQLAKSGETYVEQQKISKIKLSELIQNKLKIKSNLTIIIHADKNSSTQNLINLIDLSKKAGAEKFVFVTEK